MAKRYKTRVQPIKSAEKTPAEKGKLHEVVLIERGTYWDAVCKTCNAQVLCGGDGAKGMLEKWAAWHATKVEVHTQGEQV